MKWVDPATTDSALAIEAPSVSSGQLIIAVATYNRPAGLARLLAGIEALRFEGEEPRIEVVIVDNSPDANARSVVEPLTRTYRWPLHYGHEPERGIAQARNRALEIAAARDAAWIAFVDDDEVPDPGWLSAMIATQRRTGAEVVVGAVEPAFEREPPNWLRRGGFFATGGHQDGQALRFGYTSNVLVDASFLRRHRLTFDEAFSLTGGEDTRFFDQLLRQAGEIVFCPSGVVRETIVQQRATLRWLVQRWTRTGNTDGRLRLLNDAGFGMRVRTLAAGAARIAVGLASGLLTMPLALFGRGDVPARGLRIACRGLGFAFAAVGRVIEEYRHVSR